MSTHQQLLSQAMLWRAENPQHQGGVVLIWEGEAYGWKNSLRDATHERPGVHAVDANEHIFIAEGGNDYDGAKAWVVFDATHQEGD